MTISLSNRSPSAFAESLIEVTDKSYEEFQDMDDELRWGASARLGSQFLLSWLAVSEHIRKSLSAEAGFHDGLRNSVRYLRQQQEFREWDDELRWATAACTACGFTYAFLAGEKLLPESLPLSEDEGDRFFEEVAEQIDRILHQRRQSKTDAAVAAFRQEVKLQPDDPDAWLMLGFSYSEQGKHDDAVTAFSQAIKLRPDFPESWNGLG